MNKRRVYQTCVVLYGVVLLTVGILDSIHHQKWLGGFGNILALGLGVGFIVGGVPWGRFEP